MMARFDPRDPAFTRLGRRAVDEPACELWWSGSGVRVRMEGSRLELEAEAAEDEHLPWLAVSVDGAPVARFPMMAGVRRYDLLGRMEAGVPHEVEITRDTQPTGKPVRLLALLSDGALTAPAPRPRLIEFLGDSLTVGEGTVGPTGAMEWRMAWISNLFAYPTLVANALNADKRVIALGGWGAYLSYDANPDHVIGAIYDTLCGGAEYDFSAQRPADAVVINLGTNDCSGIDQRWPGQWAEGEAAFRESAAALMAQVRARNPQAAILWVYGMCGDRLELAARRAVVDRRSAGDANVRFVGLRECAGGCGSRSHPSREVHRRAAERLTEALKEVLD